MLRDANGLPCCVCCDCSALVPESWVNFPNLHCKVCRGVPVVMDGDPSADEGSPQGESLQQPNSSMVLPPPGAKVRVMGTVPRDWKIGDLNISDALKKHKARGGDNCRVLGCVSAIPMYEIKRGKNKGKMSRHKSVVCDDCRGEEGVWLLKKDSCVHQYFCSHCGGCSNSSNWPRDTKGELRLNCSTCTRDADGTIVSKTFLTRPGDGRTVRRKPADLVAVRGARASDGLQCAFYKPNETGTCCVVNCGADRKSKLYCGKHANDVLHCQGLPGDLSQRRYCRRCQKAQPAKDFTWEGQCGPQCNRSGLHGRKQSTNLLPKMGRGVAGVAVPDGQARPSQDAIRAAATELGLGVLRDDLPCHGRAVVMKLRPGYRAVRGRWARSVQVCVARTPRLP